MVGRATRWGYSYVSAAVVLAVVLAVGLTVAGAVALVTNSDDGVASAQGDTDEAFSGTSDLRDAETRFLGNDTGDKAGFRVASAGDVNGDGERDVLVSTPFEDGAGEEAGAVYLFYGPVDAGDVNVTDADVTFHGAAGDRAGWAIAAGDLDGDNDSDVVVGAPYNDSAGNDSGAVYVVHGDEDLPERVDLPADADATYRGANASDETGYSVATVRGNESDALLVGAPYADTTDVDAGAAYLLENATAGERSVDEAANVTYAGASVRDQAGWSVADAGDFTGDGRHEVVVASPFNHTGDANYTGAVSILSTDYDDGETVPVRDGRTYDGVGEDDRAGWSVSTAGDVNDDGHADVAVGAPYNDSAGEDSGAAYVVHGGADLSGNASLGDADVVLHGENEGDRAGWSVADAGSGDVDCNGYDDVLVGAPFHDGTAVDAGAAYVVHGGESTGVGSLADAGATLRGEAEGDRAGWSVAAANDSTGDGDSDVLVGATHNDTNSVNAGAAYLVAGDCPVKPTEDDIERPTEPPRGPPAGPAGTPTETPTDTPTETPEPTPPNASITTECVDEGTNRVRVTAANLRGENVTVAFDSENDSADFDRTLQPDANGTVDETFDVGDEDNVTVTVYLGDGAGGVILDEAFVRAGACDAPAEPGPPTARITTQCLGDQTNRIHVYAENLSGQNVTVEFDSANDSADFTETVQPAANGTVHEHYEVTDEYNLTVTVYLGDDTGGDVLDAETFRSGACDVIDGPAVDEVQVDTDCDGDRGRLTLENRNDGVDLRVVVTDENGSEVHNATLAAASTEVLENLPNGTYTVVTRFDGEEIGEGRVDVRCPAGGDGPPEDSEPATPTAQVTTQCLGDQTNRVHVYAENLSGEDVTVAFDSANDSADFTETVQPAADGSVHEQYDVSDEHDLTVTVYRGDDTSGDVLAEETFPSGTCDAFAGPPIEAVQVDTDCDGDRGRLTLENRNDGTDVRVVVTDENGSEVYNETLQAASTDVLDGLDDGNYTVVTRFDGDRIGEERVEVDCQPDDGGQAAAAGVDELEPVDVVTDCDDEQGSISFTNPNRNDSVDVVITEDVGIETVDTTLAPGESDTAEDLPDRNYTVVTTADGERLGEEVVRIACEPAEPGVSGAPDGNETDADNETDVGPPGNGTDDGGGADAGDEGNETDVGDTDASDSGDDNGSVAAAGGDQGADSDGTGENGDEEGGEDETTGGAGAGDGGDGGDDDPDGASDASGGDDTGGDSGDGADGGDDGGGSSAENAGGSGDGTGDENATG